MNNDRGARDQEIADSDGNGRARPLGGRPGLDAADGAAPGHAGVGADGDSEWAVSTGSGGAGADMGSMPGPDNGPGPDDGRRLRGSHRADRRHARSWWVELPILFVFALVLALLIKAFVVQAFYIPSSSMENTLDVGDKVLVNKLIYDFRPIHRGDIVVFNGDGSWNAAPVASQPPLVRLWDAITGLFGTAPGVHDYIKRVVGLPGDHVACCDAQGRVTVNGVPLSEKSYLYPGNAPSAVPFNITVAPGRLWVMGDHREVSWDSRGHQSYPGDGTIPEDHVVGRAFLIIAPVSRWRILPIPATFEQPKLAALGPAADSRTGAPALDAWELGAAQPVLPGPAAPLALGFAGAIPLTWLQRRLRRRLGGSRRRG